MNLDKLTFRRKNIPKEVNIDAIMYRVVETTDGMIIFTETCGMCFCGNRMAFHHPRYGGWQVELFPIFATYYMMDHVAKAYELVQEWCGDDFGRPYKKIEGLYGIKRILYIMWLQKIYFPITTWWFLKTR